VPLVLAIACWRSTEPVDPAAAREPAPGAAIAPSDTRVGAARSADRSSVAAVPIDAADPADAAAPNPLPVRRRSSTGRPPTITPSGTVIARVIGISVQGNSAIVTIGAGTSSGVRWGWQCQLINADGRSVDTDDCVILRVDKGVTVARTKLTSDQIRGYSRALLAPPP
jgi:hypothetical protein